MIKNCGLDQLDSAIRCMESGKNSEECSMGQLFDAKSVYGCFESHFENIMEDKRWKDGCVFLFGNKNECDNAKKSYQSKKKIFKRLGTSISILHDVGNALQSFFKTPTYPCDNYRTSSKLLSDQVLVGRARRDCMSELPKEVYTAKVSNYYIKYFTYLYLTERITHFYHYR